MSEWKIKTKPTHTVTMEANFPNFERLTTTSTIEAKSKKEFEQKIKAKINEIKKGKYFDFFGGCQINGSKIQYFSVSAKY